MIKRTASTRWPALFFALFSAAVLAAFLVLKPGWGFMDDAQALQTAEEFWAGKTSLPALIMADVRDHGRFRPIYHLWIVMVYATGRPLAIYLLILAMSLAVLLGWGRILGRLFPDHDDGFTRYVYPLLFFAFLPFWNVLTYISIQEKFLFLFGSCSFFFAVASYDRRSAGHMAAALVLGVMAVMGKETGLALWGAYGIYAVLDLCLWRRAPALSLVLVGATALVGLGYVSLVKGIHPGQYADGYTRHLSAGSLLDLFVHASLVVKAVGLLAGATVIAAMLRKTPPVFLICPLFVIIYLVLLLPWGFPNYLLAPLGPWVMACVYFWGRDLWHDGRGATVARSAAALIIIAVLVLDIVPRIGKMADKRKVAVAVSGLRQPGPVRFFYPMPFEETGAALGRFSGGDVVTVGLVRQQDLRDGTAYLVVNDEAAPILLDNVEAGPPVYTNMTWRIYALRPAPGEQRQFSVPISYSPLKAIKDKIYHS